jgi:hypothetical protein
MRMGFVLWLASSFLAFVNFCAMRAVMMSFLRVETAELVGWCELGVVPAYGCFGLFVSLLWDDDSPIWR